jgi:hypothetical protein
MTLAALVTPGDVIGIPYRGVCHTGIVSGVEAGAVRVIHKSKRRGRVVEESAADFARGRAVERLGYPGALPPAEVVGRARARIGEPWTYRDNCQRFCASVHGASFRSRDADTFALLLFGICGAAFAGSRRYRPSWR